MEVRELMTGGPLTVSPDTGVIHAHELMARERIRHLPVVDHGTLVGIVTDRDIRLCLPSQATSLSVGEVNYQLSRLPVTTIMSAPVVTVGPDDDVADAARLLLNRDIGGLPVMGAGHVLGILTRGDIVRAYARTPAPPRSAPERRGSADSYRGRRSAGRTARPSAGSSWSGCRSLSYSA